MASSHEDDIKQMKDDSKSVMPVDMPVLSDTKSPGVARIEALNAHTSLVNRCFIFFGLFLVAYAYGLDGSLRGVYQPYATAGFETHSTLATIGQSTTWPLAHSRPRPPS
jgi:SIT family siderophore-iron:H+ symporter-like MFS transporter